jgi:hypothetical protein
VKNASGSAGLLRQLKTITLFVATASLVANSMPLILSPRPLLPCRTLWIRYLQQQTMLFSTVMRKRPGALQRPHCWQAQAQLAAAALSHMACF